MKDDLADALIPVFWARDHIPALQERLLNWQRRYPYEVVAERDPVQADMDLVVARLRTPLDPLIIGDVGAIINSIRTGLDLMMAAVVARHVASPSWFPNFPICESRDDFLDAVGKLQSRYQLTADEADAIRRTKAYDGGDHLLWHIAKLDNLRKHQRLLVVEAILIEAHVTQIYMVQRLMEHSHAQNCTRLFRVPVGTFQPTRGNTLVEAGIFLNEIGSVGVRNAIVGARCYVDRVKALIEAFP